MQSREVLKSYFTTGSKPTEAQFSEALDSYWHKDDVIFESSEEEPEYTAGNGIIINENTISAFIDGSSIVFDQLGRLKAPTQAPTTDYVEEFNFVYTDDSHEFLDLSENFINTTTTEVPGIPGVHHICLRNTLGNSNNAGILLVNRGDTNTYLVLLYIVGAVLFLYTRQVPNDNTTTTYSWNRQKLSNN